MPLKTKYGFFVICIGVSLFLIAINFMEIVHWTKTDKRGLFFYKANLVKVSSSKLGANGSIYWSQEQPTILTNAKIVIIIAYMRTGSSLTGSVLQEYPGTFYLFEPIRSVWERFIDTRDNSTVQLTYPNGTSRYYSTADRDHVITDEIKNWLTCNFERQNMASLSDGFHRSYTKFMRKLQACTVHKRKANHYQSLKLRHSYPFYRPEFWEICVQRTKDKCREAPIVALKFIRLSLAVIKELMPLVPNLKVIHLNRDPRGIFNSRSHLKNVRETVTPTEIKTHCRRWAADLSIVNELSGQYEGRIMSVKYENLAEQPHETFSEICDFIGIPYTDGMKKYVIGMTSASRDGCSFCQQRKNSTLTASKWRHELNFTTAKFIYDTCQTGNQILQYLPFNNTFDMRNFSLPFHN